MFRLYLAAEEGALGAGSASTPSPIRALMRSGVTPLRHALPLLLLLGACPMQVDEAGTGAPTTQAAPGPTTPEAEAASGGMPQDPSARVASQPNPVGSAEAMTGQSDAVPIRLDVQPPGEEDPKFTQAALKAGDHVTFTGNVKCDGCGAPMVMRVLKFQPPGQLQLGAPPSPLTVLPIPEQGAFSIAVPRGADPVVLELLIDLDKNGKPDRGERLAVVVRDGHLTPDQDRSGFVIDASDSNASPWAAPAADNPPDGG